MASSPDISFEHFDPRFEMNNLDSNGKPIRIRKKPGRKPNPPSPQQRKAQNRAAQRAFRERKRCEMKQAQTAVKQCLYIRDQALGEAQRWKTELEETRYENNYLKGSLLILKLACIANKVDVPNLWDTGAIDSDSINSSKAMDIPQSMDIFLDKQRNIINLPQENGSTSPATLSPSSPMSVPPSPNSLECTSPSSMVHLHQQETYPLLSSSPSSCYSGSTDFDSVQDIPPTITNPSQCLSLGSNHLLSPKLLNTENDHTLIAGLAPLSAIDNTDLVGHHDHVTGVLDNGLHTDLEKSIDATILPQQSTPVIDPKTGLERLRTVVLAEEVDHFGSSPLSLSSSRLKSAPPMNTMDALQYIRTVKNLDKDDRTLFKPTEIQRVIPHDTRIDQVPCPMMRDLMILYQDFYNANELFDLLMGSAMFSGGNLENFDDWMMPPAFLYKFWFLCPSQRLQQLDILVNIATEMGQKMISILMNRRTMYFGNGHLSGDLHFTESMQQTQPHQQHSQLYDQRQAPTHELDMMSFDAFSKDDYSLDAMMTFVEDSDLLASV